MWRLTAFRVIGWSLTVGSLAWGKIHLTPKKILKLHFGHEVQINTVSIVLNEKEKTRLKDMAQVNIQDGRFIFFQVTKDNKTKGFAGVDTRRVRSKNQTSLHIIRPEGKLKAVEIIAFHEPPEYLPQKNWLKYNFHGKSEDSNLQAGRGVSIVSGATRTAESLSRSARLMLAIWKLKFGEGIEK